tara:strand:+ start:3085 stop:4047 length:963 start_codon:yes stop_codon:yes gene_type:complete
LVNASLNWASIVGIVLAVCGAGLYFLRSFKPALARDYDVFFAAIGLLCGGILFFQGWRLDPILQFGQFLLAGTTVFFAYESVRLRGIATDQARRSSYFDDEPELPRSSRGGLSDADSDRNYDRFEESQPINRRFAGREDYQEEYSDDENYGRRPSRAAIPEQAVSRRPRNISSSEINSRGAERDRRMERFNSESSSDRASSFGDRRTSRQETRQGTRPSASGQTSSRRRNGAPSTQTSSSRLNSDNSTRASIGSKRPSKTNNNIEDAAFSSAEKGVRRASRRSAKNPGANPANQRPSSKSSYSSSTRKSRPRDNSSRFDD